MEICREKKLIDGKKFKRIEFPAVRKEDILSAINNPREINQNLVNAAITRRFLDRFFGYKISPITKRRTIFGSSAGRVQSPALKILCEKEKEIEVFVSKEFWDVNIELTDNRKHKIECTIVSQGQKKFDKFTINNEKKAKALQEAIKKENLFRPV